MASEHPYDSSTGGTTPAAAAAVVDSRTPAVIAPGHTFASVTEAISHPVMTKRTPIGWFFGFAIGFIFLNVLNVTIVNLVMTGSGRFIELQGSGEESTFSREELDAMLALGRTGIDRLVALQSDAVNARV